MNTSLPGEFELIARLTHDLPSYSSVNLGVGDDAAILDLGGDMLLLATCDSQVQGVHFTLSISSPQEIGRKALAVNLSDIAAMGGEPRYALISLILPPQISLDLLEAIYTGIRQEAKDYTTAIIGGNIAGTENGGPLVLDITLLGVVERGHALTRSGARVGDILFVTGALGNAAAGLYTLLHPDKPYPPDALNALRTHFRTPHPRVRIGRILSQLGPEIVTAALDLSDGLSGDLGHLCERSHVGAIVEAAQLPLSPSLRSISTIAGINALSWALHGGEDYELLFTVSPGHQETVISAVQSATELPLTAIGTIIPPQDGMKLILADGRKEILVPRSWNHSGPHH